MHMDDIKLCTKNDKEFRTLIHAVIIYRQDVGVMKSGKRHLTDGIEVPNRDKIRTLRERETYKYLGILEAAAIKPEEMRKKNKKEYFRISRKLLETKLYSNHFVKGKNTLAFPSEDFRNRFWIEQERNFRKCTK